VLHYEENVGLAISWSVRDSQTPETSTLRSDENLEPGPPQITKSAQLPQLFFSKGGFFFSLRGLGTQRPTASYGLASDSPVPAMQSTSILLSMSPYLKGCTSRVLQSFSGMTSVYGVRSMAAGKRGKPPLRASIVKDMETR